MLGNAKGVFTTALSIFIFQNPYTVTSVTGYLVTVTVRTQNPEHCTSLCCVACTEDPMYKVSARIWRRAAMAEFQGLWYHSTVLSC